MSKTEQVSRIRTLIDQYLEIVDSDKNKENLKLWEDPRNWTKDKWRATPNKSKNFVPFTVSLDNAMWGEVFRIKVDEWYKDPYNFMETQLKLKIYQHEYLNDNTAFTDELHIWLGVVTELSWFGSELLYYDNKEAWIKGPVINEYDDLDRLEPPDFYKSGLMPIIHRYYEVMNEVADGKLKINFPHIQRGPFCIVAHLRGLDRMLLDLALNPDFVHKAMRFMVDFHMSWTEQRNKFVKEDKRKCILYNDDVSCPNMGPKMYEELVFPYEKELAEHYGGIHYWHSCGNTTPLLPLISKLPAMDIFHSGPWTSYKEADAVFGDRTALEICLNPQKDVLEASIEEMEAKLKDIKESCVHNNYAVRADNFMPFGEFNAQIDQVKRWIGLAQKHLGS